MKRFIFLLTTIFICTIARADNININWIVGDNTYATTQCEMGNDLILPTTPTKTGYTFRGWRIANYIPIEYLESTGTQYIDTGVLPNNNTRAVADIMVVSYVNEDATYMVSIFGGRTDAQINSFSVWVCSQTNPDKTRSDYGTTQITNNTGVSLLAKRIIIDKNKNITTYFYNGSVFATITSPVQTFNTPYNLYMFRTNNAGNPTGFPRTRFYSFQIYDNDVLVRDFIPVLDGDGVPCMYDKVEGEFYYNAGTGDFIAGPVIGGE